MSELERYTSFDKKDGWYFWKFKSFSDVIFRIQSLPEYQEKGPYVLELVIAVKNRIVRPSVATNFVFDREPSLQEIYEAINESSHIVGYSVIPLIFK